MSACAGKRLALVRVWPLHTPVSTDRVALRAGVRPARRVPRLGWRAVHRPVGECRNQLGSRRLVPLTDTETACVRHVKRTNHTQITDAVSAGRGAENHMHWDTMAMDTWGAGDAPGAPALWGGV